MKERIMRGWNIVRVLWLAAGIGILIQALLERNYLMLIPALYFVLTALANVGCCASGGCATNFKENNQTEIHEMEVEEVQSKK